MREDVEDGCINPSPQKCEDIAYGLYTLRKYPCSRFPFSKACGQIPSSTYGVCVCVYVIVE